ncbi:hypothetical protein ACROYT_G012911 [Oculina patagonica]
MATTVEEVCPSVEVLTRRETDVSLSCPTQGCSRVFQNRSCLRMHLIKTHGVASDGEEKKLYVRGQSKSQVEKHFYCPVKHCVRGQGTKRPFPRMSKLKQHYMTVHAEKKNVCSKCGRGFGLPDACRRHELKCGQLFTCSCGCPYTTIEALLTHARRQMHKLPECYTNKKKSSKPPVPASAVTLVIVKPTLPVIPCPEKNSEKKGGQFLSSTRLCPILPKPGPATALEASQSFCNTVRKQADTKSVQTQTPFDVHSMHTQTSGHSTNAEQACDSCTQTPPPTASGQFQFSNDGGSLGIGFNNQASVGTQVAMLADQCDFGVGTDDSFLAQLGCFTGSGASQPFELSERMPQTTPVQHLAPMNSFVMGQQRSSFVSTNENSMQTLDIDPMCLNTQTQTNLTSTDLALCDLRPLNSAQTQTYGLEQVPLEDNETQTLISLLGIDTTSSIDSGTQTQNFLGDLFDTQDIELTESQTQTWFSDYSITSPGLDNSGNEFVYKTLDDFVDIHTQTSIVMSDFSELADDTEFANSQTQTLQSDFGCSSLLSSSVQTDTHWSQVTETDGQFRCGSANSQTQTLQSDFGCSSLLSSSVQTDTHWSQMTETDGQFRSGFATSTSSQTQTCQNIVDQSCLVSNVETQT